MRRTVRHRGGKADGGSSWISYSDMMAALLLVFVLILCYSVYQYFLMLETKTAELDEQSALLSAQQSTLDEQRTTLSAQQEALSTQQQALTEKENELNSALTQLDEQRGLLEEQTLTLEEQRKVIIAAQNALASKEDELDKANAELKVNQQQLADATILLGQQQDAMNQQQQRLDDLVGVRTKIVRELTDALSSARLKASVDANTGDIMLESAVFFEFGKNNVKEEGKAFLDRFIPVYLGVLMRPEYSDYLGEIIIEGHTDSSGTYLTNLELSQKRALAVAEYCLSMRGMETELDMLRGILTVKGRSFSDPIYKEDGTEDAEASRRVEFKFRMKDSEMIDEIRNILSTDDAR